MKEPDKIYIPQHNIEAGTIQELDELIVEGSVEYIRKETLLEWLENKVQLSYGVATDALVEVIEKVKAL